MAQNPGPRSKEYWQEKTDIKKLLIKYLEKWWAAVIGIAAGIVIAIAVYFIYHACADGISYQAYSQFYLEFAADESGEAYQYYNGYTWNELMTTDLIADGTLDRLDGSGIDLARLEADTNAEILSDIRVLRVTFTDSDSQTCAQIQKATEGSLEELGNTAKEFTSIKTIKSVEPVRVYADSRLKQAILLGALIGLVVTLIAGWFMSILDDRICVPSDAYGLPAAFLGVRLKDENTKKAEKLGRLLDASVQDLLCSPVSMDVCDFLESDDMAGAIEKAKQAEGIILEVPYNKVKKTMLNAVIDCLTRNGCNILGIVIREADNRFYSIYM